MFSIYQHEKVLGEKERMKSRERLQKSAEPNRDLLTLRYKERINGTLIMLNKDAKAAPNPNRSTTPTTFRRTFLVSTGFLPESERILEAESRNKWLDTTPNNKQALKLRPREKDKEIQPQLKINLKTEQERLASKIAEQKQIFDTTTGQNFYKNYFGAEKPKFSGGKEIHSYYHLKTHFKTIESLALDLHNSTRNPSKLEIQKKYDDEKLGMIEGKIKQNSVPKGIISKEEVVPLSEEVLEKYGFWKNKQPFLKKESSRFISSRLERSRPAT